MWFFGQKAKQLSLSADMMRIADDAVVVIDRYQTIVMFNDGASRIFGYGTGEALGLSLDMLIPERFHLAHGVMVDEFGAGKANTRHMGERARQIHGRRKDGSEFIASVQIMRLSYQGQPYYGAIVRDISKDKQTEDELLRLAATDPLTGAFNRREFTAIAEREALRAVRYSHPLSLLMCDLDHFKKLNDIYGHAAGDRVLQRFTQMCSNTLRNVDIFARWGGEEFVALLPETDVEGAAIIAERLRRQMAEMIVTSGDQNITTTVSIGLSQYRDGEIAIDGPLGRADSAVYEAKKNGRDRISIYRG